MGRPARKTTPESPTPSDARKDGSKRTPTAADFLEALLPSGWASYFNTRPAGRYIGLSIVCPICDETPPPTLIYNSRKWRWMTVHMASHKTRLSK